MKTWITIFFRAIAVIILLVLPFLPVTESFFLPENQVNYDTFGQYIVLCVGIIAIGFGLVYFLKKTIAFQDGCFL